MITEVQLGESLQCTTVVLREAAGTGLCYHIGCLALEDGILVVVTRESGLRAFMLLFRAGKLLQERVSLERLRVCGSELLGICPYLCRWSEDRVLLSFENDNRFWFGRLAPGELYMSVAPFQAIPARGFCTRPLDLMDGSFLVAGGAPNTCDIVIMRPGREPLFEKVGTIPGDGRDSTVTVLLSDRFVLGFGGAVTGNRFIASMWVYDLRTRRSSCVDRVGEWHQRDQYAPLFSHQDGLYILAGYQGVEAHYISFQDLVLLIDDLAIRQAFGEALCGWKPGDRSAPVRTDNALKMAASGGSS